MKMNFPDGRNCRVFKKHTAFPGGFLCTFIFACLALFISPVFSQEQPQRISPGELQSMLQKGEVILVNIMSGLECRDHQIPGSVCVPCEEFAQRAPGILKGHPQAIVIYGDRDKDATACLQSIGSAAREFKISVLDGGLAGWKRAGLEIDSPGRVPRAATKSISAASLKALIAQSKQPVIIDVRPEQAFNANHISGALNIPLNQLPARYYEIPPEHPILIIDEDGRRAFLAASYLIRRGFGSVQRLRGGMAAWDREAAKEKKK
jgi:hydroxyacylglutathione hydrolase